MKLIEITDYNSKELDIFARTSEAALANLYAPYGGIFIAESPKVIERALAAGYEPESILAQRGQLSGDGGHIFDMCPDVPVYTAPMDVLTKITGFKLTRGILCAMKRRTLPGMDEICNGAARLALLENVVNPTNIGAIFRSAAALGIDGILLTPGCADPLYRRAARVSMGTVFQIPWTYIDKTVKWPEEGMAYLHDIGFKTAAFALHDDSVSIDDDRLMSEEKLVIILGTEGDGLADVTIADCDYTVKIPMAHGVDSLNVAAASAVAFWQLGKI
ncbi:putative uncharacterized protein [Butyrivibrio sp. CAG:318]|nr:putative uncharacterized protein [Butyrivibrio sp. CAG:318]